MGDGTEILLDPNQDRFNADGTETTASSPAASDSDPKSLEQITRSAQHLTGANGAALAISDRSSMSCRACSGYLAPPVGTQLNTDSGLTATCVKAGEIVRCDDTRIDPRADAAKCGDARSILAVPIFDGPIVAGVLEVLSAKPHRFTDQHVTTLQLLARLIENHLNYKSSETSPAATPSPSTSFLSKNGIQPVPEPARVGCLACGNRNPHGSQFCNRCGVILFGSPDPWERNTAFELGKESDPSANEGLKEIYKLISENIGQTSWQDISAKLHEKLQALPPQDRPQAAATKDIVPGEDTTKRFGAGGVRPLTTQPLEAVRRSPWR
jgi:hypothetical protein